MAIGPKRNEGGTVTGVRPGTRAQARYVRVSAYKAREVLNLVRGLDVKRADEVLQFTDRSVADDVRKVLASAVANAVNNDAQDAEELFVLACFADEGPTLKRFTPRARGRAGRIRKRTCHITVVVERMSDEQLARKAAKEAGRGGAGGNRARRVAASTGGAVSRRDRVAASRSARAGDVNDSIEEATSDDAAQVTSEGETVQAFADTFVAEPYGSGSASANADGSQPEGYDIKGNADSMLYHVPGSRFYDQTIAEVWFATEEAAEAAGFAKPASQRKNNGEDGADVTDGEDA